MIDTGSRLRLLALALLGALCGCQCGDRGSSEGASGHRSAGAESSEGAPSSGAARTAPPPGVHRILVTEREVEIDDLTVGDARALAKAPGGGGIAELGRALKARTGRGSGTRKILVEAKPKASAAVVRRAIQTAREAGVETLVLELPEEGGKVRRLEPKAPLDKEAPLRVRLKPEETRMRAAGGKKWTVPNKGPARDLKLVADILLAQGKKLDSPDPIDVAVEGGVSYVDLFGVLDAAAAAGFTRPRLLGPEPSGAARGDGGPAPAP